MLVEFLRRNDEGPIQEIKADLTRTLAFVAAGSLKESTFEPPQKLRQSNEPYGARLTWTAPSSLRKFAHSTALFTAVSRCVAVMHWLSGLCCGLYSLTVLHTLKWKNVSTQAQKLVYPDVTHVRDIPGSASVFMGFKGHTLNEKH